MDLFESFSPELQERLLLSVIAPSSEEDDGEAELTADEIAELTREMMVSLIEAVKNGDEATLAEFLLAGRDYSDPLMSEYNTKLWDERDAGMAEKLEEFLSLEEADGDFFVAVGAGHTLGDTGLVHVMTEKGYTVERIW